MKSQTKKKSDFMFQWAREKQKLENKNGQKVNL